MSATEKELFGVDAITPELLDELFCDLNRDIRSSTCGFTNGTMKITVVTLNSWASRLSKLIVMLRRNKMEAGGTAPGLDQLLACIEQDAPFAARLITEFLRMGVCPAGYDRDDLRAFVARLERTGRSVDAALVTLRQDAKVKPHEGYEDYNKGATTAEALAWDRGYRAGMHEALFPHPRKTGDPTS